MLPPSSRDLAHARAIVAAYRPRGAADGAARERILEFLERHPDALHRSCLAGHLTGSALLVDAAGRRCLLHHHRKLDRWLQFGGHADGEAELARVAWRETLEESGIEPASISPAPVDLDVHAIPARGAEPEHLHLDVRYIVHAPEGARAHLSDESQALAWLTPAQAHRRVGGDSLARLLAIAFGS